MYKQSIITVLPLAIFFALCIQLINRYIRLNKEATTISGILSSIAIYICAIPCIIVFGGDEYMLRYSYNCLLSDVYSYISCYISITLFLLFLIVNYEYGLSRNRNRVIDNHRLSNISIKIGYFTLIVGGLSFIIYAQAFGGIETLLLKAEYMRSFTTNKANLVDGQAYILVIPARLITVSPYLFIIHRQYTSNKIQCNILIAISSILSCLFYLTNAGKTDVLVFGLSIFLPIISYFFKHKWIITISVASLCLCVVSYLDALFIYLGTGVFILNEENGNLSYLSQFSYPIRNLLNIDNIPAEHGFRLGQDFITGILNIIPGVNFEPSYQPTSEFFGGYDWKSRGGVPNDAITFGYLQFGYLGVMLVATIIGRVCACIDSCIRLLSNTFEDRVLKCTLTLLFFTMFINADVISIVRNQFTLTILSVCILLSCPKQKCQF